MVTRPNKPLNTVVGLVIIVLVSVAAIVGFIADGGIEYFAHHPLRIVIVLGAAVLGAVGFAILARRFPRCIDLLKAVSITLLALALTVCALLLAYTLVRHWGTVPFEGYGLGMVVAAVVLLGALAVPTWRECHTSWNDCRRGTPGDSPRANRPGR